MIAIGEFINNYKAYGKPYLIIRPEELGEILDLLNDGRINRAQAKKVLAICSENWIGAWKEAMKGII